MTDIVVVGAGQAGASLVAKLRALGFEGGLTLIGEEPVLPYQRPPLSKKYLLGDMELERLFLRPADFYRDQNIQLKLSSRAEWIDRAAQEVVLADERVPYDQLALTTGMVPRQLPDELGGALDGVHVIRSLADVDALAAPFETARRILVIGGGYIGLEAAAVAATRGLDVTLVEIAPRILSRVASVETSDYFRALHERHGVTIFEGVGVNRILGDDRATGTTLSDGRTIEADLVIVGIGLIPRCRIAEQSGLEVENGIKVDAFGQSSDPRIWAAGDCASFPHQGARIRLESVQNAIDMAEAVAANMLGAQEPYEPHPWFWSDQYETKLQIAGLNTGYDSITTRRSDTDHLSFWYYRGDRLIAVDAINDARSYMIGKRLIEAGKSPPPEVVADPEANLKALLK